MDLSKQHLTIPLVSSISEDEQNHWVRVLSNAMPDHKITKLSDLNSDNKLKVEVAIVANPAPKDLDSLPNLIWIQSLWAGVETLVSDLPNETVKLVRMNDPKLSSTMAEAVLAWTYYLHRKMPHYQKQQQQKLWQPINIKDVSETTVGILGLGSLGKAAAEKLTQQGFKVCGWSRTRHTIEGVESFYGSEQMTDLIKKSDILIVLLPLTPETTKLLDEKMLSYLPEGASVINFARSRIIDNGALLKLLKNKHIDHAVLDVFNTEPLPEESLFWEHPDITVLPHISAPTNHQTASLIVSKNIDHFVHTGEVPTSVNRERGY